LLDEEQLLSPKPTAHLRLDPLWDRLRGDLALQKALRGKEAVKTYKDTNFTNLR